MKRATALSKGAFSYQDVVRFHLGDRAGLAAEVTIALYQGLTCCISVIVIGDAFAPWITAAMGDRLEFQLHRPLAIVLFSLPGFYISFYATMEKLAVFMGIGVFVVSMIAALIIGSGCYAEFMQSATLVTAPGFNPMPTGYIGSLSAMPTFAFALAQHVGTPRIFLELSAELRHSWNMIAMTSYVFVSAIYMSVGLLSYQQFGATTAGNVLINYRGSSLGFTLVLLNGLQSIFGYALNHYMCRAAVYSCLVRCGAVLDYDREIESILGQPSEMPSAYRRLLTCLIYIVIVFVAACCEDLGQATRYLGATFGALLFFTFPAFLSWCLPDATPSDRIAGVVYGLLGCVCCIFGLMD
jgi:amino acid permease